MADSFLPATLSPARADVGGAEARMLSGVASHVDELSGPRDGSHRGFGWRIRFTDKRDSGSVGRLDRIYVEQLHAVNGLQLVR